MQLHGLIFLTALGLPIGYLLARYTGEEVTTYRSWLVFVREAAVAVAVVLAPRLWLGVATAIVYTGMYRWKWRSIVPLVLVTEPRSATAVFLSLLCAGSLEEWPGWEQAVGVAVGTVLGVAALVL